MKVRCHYCNKDYEDTRGPAEAGALARNPHPTDECQRNILLSILEVMAGVDRCGAEESESIMRALERIENCVGLPAGGGPW